MFSLIKKIRIRFIILIVSSLVQSYSYIHAEKISLSDSSKYAQILREGDISSILNDIINSPDLQLERLAAYFFHQRINQYRLDNELTTLYWDDRMWLAARNHNLYMIKYNASSHQEVKDKTLFTGINPWDRIQYVMYNGFKMKSYSENILMNYSAINQRSIIDNAKSIADESFEQWKNSPPHNKNMLNPEFFAHGTSFYRGNNGVSQVFGTTNFGNASDFEVKEIAISWNDSLAKFYPPSAEEKRKPYVAGRWSVQTSEKELFNVVISKMPKQKSAYNADLTLTAEMGMKANNGIENDSKKVASTKKRYLNATKNLKLKFIFSKLHEKVYRFRFTKEQLTDKSALKVIDESISNELPASTKIDSWGGKCRLISKDSSYVCDINLIYEIKK